MLAPVLVVAGLLLCLLAPPVSAQSTPPAPGKTDEKTDEKADDKSDAKADEAAMARARRQASNPMRWILEAGRVQRKAPEQPLASTSAGERKGLTPVRALPEPAAAAPLAGSEPAAAAEPAIRVTVEPLPPPPVPTLPVVATPVTEPRSTAAEPAMPRAAAASPSSPPAEALVLPPAPGLTMASPIARLPAATLPAAEPAAEPAAGTIEPRLMHVVEPALTTDLLAELSRGVDITADLRLNADGTVAEVQLLTRTPRSVQRVLSAALSQWRFEPLAQPRVHRVQLVFGR